MYVSRIPDTRIRWTAGERLDRLFEERCDEMEALGGAGNPAVIEQGRAYSYRDIDNRANQVARHLKACGVRSGDRVAVLLERSKDVYVSLLAVMKVNAAYVPLDAAFPNERIGYILEDAGVRAIVSATVFDDRLEEFALPRLRIDADDETIRALPAGRLGSGEREEPTDELGYIIYTSGTTGKPKGVAVEHSSICNFVRVAAETYGYEPGDRVYQGMTIAFDFSVEELWVPLIAGATLVPAPPGNSLVGADLADFLAEQRITVLCCVPTLLATIERDLPDLRILLVSGEACPHHLVSRWYRSGRRILNAYGPTEATVTATLTVLYPDKPVTIGAPLPSYSVVILAEDEDALVSAHGIGEIGIAGVGLARGYVNRDDLTREKFIPDFVGLPDNPSARIYRSGDLGRFNEEGEIEYLGRKDTQVKVRGYRIELTEIESALMTIPHIAQAVVSTYEPEAGTVELVGYYSVTKGARGPKPGQIAKALRKQLPAYMVPAYFERLPVIPMTSSNKADRKSLPPPKARRCSVGGNGHTAPRNEVERLLATELSAVLKLQQVSVTDNFFDDLGAHSLLMARFCAAIRGNTALPDVSMRDIYLSQTIETLAARLVAADADESAVAPARMLPRHVPTRLQYYGCGALQFATGLCFGLAALWVLLCGFHWTYAAIEHTVELCLRVGAYILALLVAWCAIPVVAKWLLIGRWKPEAIPVWSLRYFRFWLVKSLVNTSPLALFGGGPLYNVYLRLLGARIGRNTTIRSSAPICTDMFSVGDETIIRNGTLMPGYTAEGNFIHTGPVHIGSNAFVGTASVVEIETRIGDNAQLGHSSCLQRGQAIPDGAHYHGTPAVETTADYCQVEGRRCTALRRWVYTVVPAIVGLVFAPVPILIIYHVFPYIYRLTGADKLDYSAPTSVIAYLAPSVLAMTLGLFAAFMALGILFVYATPRILNLFLEEGREYVLYGVHYLLQGLVAASSNSGAFNVLFGDSSWIVNYLRLIGFRMNSVTQTGANFGVDQVHDNPALCDIGSGTMVSDGISLANVEMSATSFRLGAVRIGARNYLGNNILFPPNGRVGDNVLLATKVMVPIDGPLRENVGLLGSPCFEIPRVVERDRGLPEPGSAAHGTLLRRKNLYNLRTIAAAVAGVLVMAFVTLLLGYVSILYYPIYGAASLIAFGVFMLPFGTAYWVMFERASLGFGGSLRPSVVSMYDDYFLFHERHWKFCANPLVKIYSGTPFKNLVSRLLGVKVGRMVFDDGAALYDKTLLEIGDYTNLNLGCVLQGHSLEEGIFKSDRITIGRECSIGCAAFVHYGVEMGDNVRLGANAFLMKGEVLPDDSVWVGNPARPVSARMARKAA